MIPLQVDSLGWLAIRHDVIPLSSKLLHPSEKTAAKATEELRASLGLDERHQQGNQEEAGGRKVLGRKRLSSAAAVKDPHESDTEQGGPADEVIPDELEGPGEDLDDFIVDDERSEFSESLSLSLLFT